MPGSREQEPQIDAGDETRRDRVQASQSEVLREPIHTETLPPLRGLGPRKRVVHDLVLECAEAAAYLTYRDSKTVIENLTKTRVSKHMEGDGRTGQNHGKCAGCRC